jgi:hypothetical protein
MWHTASDCLWTSAAEITGKAIISDQYKDLEDFFVNFLNVAAPSISMLADQLMELGRVAASPDKVEIVIWAINSMLTSEGSSSASDALKDAKVIPVMLANGLIKLRSSRENFSIIDRQKFADAFKGKAVTLVFNLTQVRNLRPFLKWFGLEKRYLSRAVTEVSRFAGLPGALISNQDRKLSCKAHALFR